MKDNNKIQLDSKTLRFLSKRIRIELESIKPLLPIEDPMIECLEAMAIELDEGAVEEERKPPQLSDWVRAVETSKLGRPQWRACEWDDSGWLIASWSGCREKVLFDVDGNNNFYCMITTNPRDPGKDGKAMYYDTPTALTAALDALAMQSGAKP